MFNFIMGRRLWMLVISRDVTLHFLKSMRLLDFVSSDIDIANISDVVVFCRREHISLIIVGPEGPLADGFVDRIGDRVAVFGPTQQGAQLEVRRLTDPLRSAYYTCEWDGIVVKADGLAAGKGVVVADDKHSAIAAAEEFLAGKFGANSSRILLEERLYGQEVSALCFTDGTTIARMPLIRDHKRLCENDLGPNTGGMGVVGPVTVSDAVNQQIDLLLSDTVASLRQEGIMYKGVIYAGLMITSSGPKLLEYNCRFGDPETEVIIMRLLKSDLYSICMSCTNGTLFEQLPIEWDKRHACGIVIATDKYPHGSDKGTLIEASLNLGILTNGGRILCVTSLAVAAVEARAKAIKACESVQFVGKFFRRDIGLERREITPSLTYQDSGVDIDEGNAFVEDIKTLVQSTLRKGTGQIGGFGAVVDLTMAGFPSGSQLVIGIDGVGTKIEVNTQFFLFNTFLNYTGIGYDVVGMCVNDVLCHCSTPMAFVDYFVKVVASMNDVLCHCSTPMAFVDYFVSGRLNRPRVREVVASITRACIDSECSLVGMCDANFQF
uniref:ATP-grasp domain-containing protein n=1 Tax=Angiostrongylus cantonensis TaxID=6313 RepID=A0A0K0DNS0_ANGCA